MERGVKVIVALPNGTVRTLTAWPERAGWHCAPPCGSTQRVYPTSEAAALAHATHVWGLAKDP